MSINVNLRDQDFKPLTKNDIEVNPELEDLQHPDLIKKIHALLTESGNDIRNKFEFQYQDKRCHAYFHRRNIGVTIVQDIAEGSKSVPFSIDRKDGQIISRSGKGEVLSQKALQALTPLISQHYYSQLNRKLNERFVPGEGIELVPIKKTKR